MSTPTLDYFAYINGERATVRHDGTRWRLENADQCDDCGSTDWRVDYITGDDNRPEYIVCDHCANSYKLKVDCSDLEGEE